jgi:methylthioribulose-1-phosphate dehydratase
MPSSPALFEAAAGLSELARRAHARGWALGTSGNFSAVISDEPLRLAITRTGVDKRVLGPDHILEIDCSGNVLCGTGRPSAEAAVHLAIVRARGAKAVAHTHSLWSTLLSDAHSASGGLAIEGYEMLKGLHDVPTHQHREWLPIIENTQDWVGETVRLQEMLQAHSAAHGFLIRRHGLYTWGRDLAEAARHLEVLEFLLEAVGRSQAGLGREA